MERPNPADDPATPPDSQPSSPPGRKAPDPRPKNPKVTPMDEGKHLEEGIEIKET